MSLSAGRLRFRIALQEPDLIDNGRGGRKPNGTGWREYARPWADVMALRGDEAVRHSVERAVQLWRVEIRKRPDVSPQHRVVWGAIVMDIKAAASNAAGDGLVLTCESGGQGR